MSEWASDSGWQAQLKALEQNKRWDEAIAFMQQIIAENPNDLEAYLFMNYLLMNLLVEERHNESKHNYYEYLTKKYFDESYAKFSHNPEYLFFTGITAVMSEWYFGIEREDYLKMLDDAMRLDPHNLLYKRSYYITLDEQNPAHKDEIVQYTQLILQKDSPFIAMLQTKGALGEYLFGLMVGWAYSVINGRLMTYEEYKAYVKGIGLDYE